ncbi:MAG TPA: flagellar assembly protein FliH [Enterovirga sp.]|jgi:flagellar assembly protein FliH|nr:flagellar assembly protein FliH [Enterovirga sp.]
MNASKFQFGDDFRGTPREEEREREALEAAEAAAFARGIEAGRREAELAMQRRLGDAADRIGAGLDAILAEVDSRVAAIEEEAVSFYTLLAGTLAGQALASYPLSTIGEAAAEAFGHLRGVPHLAVRVSDTLVEDVDNLTRRMARERGYEGRIIVLGDQDIAPGDARIEWADGGIVRERKDIQAAVNAVLAGCYQSIPT